MKIIKLAQTQVIGPVYHGTPYDFPVDQMTGKIKFFSETAQFARDYGAEKSFDRQMDADIKVLAAYLKGNVFDPQNEAHVAVVTRIMPDKITVYNNFGMSATITKEKWKEFISGVYTEPPFFSEEDLAGKKVGDKLPDNEVYGKPMAFEILKIDPDNVWTTANGTIWELKNGRWGFGFEKDETTKMRASIPIEEIANDILNLDRSGFQRKYRDFERNHSFHISKRSRHPTTTYNNDVWRWLEGDNVLEWINEAGFDIVKSREHRQVTYAVLPSAEIIPITGSAKA